MASTTAIIERLVREAQEERGFVQRSPVRTGVWHQLLAEPDAQIELLLIPMRNTTAGKLCVEVNRLITDRADTDWCTYNQSVVSGRLDFEMLVTRVLPLSDWWQRYVEPAIDEVVACAARGRADRAQRAVLGDLDAPRASGRVSSLSAEMLWCIRMLGVVSHARAQGARARWPSSMQQLRRAAELLRKARAAHPVKAEPQLFAVSRDRGAVPCLAESVRTIKGDATRELFDIECKDLIWAIVDSGVDRTHPAFADGNGQVRVERTLDFTRLGTMLRLASSPDEADRRALIEHFGLKAADVRKLARAIMAGDEVDWEVLGRALTVDAGDAAYFESLDPHGTQVAGIIGARSGNPQMPPGVCPDIRLLDLRVIAAAEGDEHTEFHIISALQFIRYLNRNKDKPVVHGVNLSLSLPHSVTDYACGQTPICEECDRLVASGIVVVAAAGNYGFDQLDLGGPAQTGGYRDLSVTDPGNTESVITVGSTHSKYPYRYGVSYFSSRGPTGDGRAKPDLVAPGESIFCPSARHAYEHCHGTSMAAPHVSGAAALLMARHRELIGDPTRVKQVLCSTATDLARARDSQGYGLVDVLRAIQSI
jgi:serine protease AprX